jgi:hypothetical protein
MNPKSTLVIASIAFAVLWTVFMLWWNAPMDTAKVVILAISGALAGVLWYWGMRRFGPPSMKG